MTYVLSFGIALLILFCEIRPVQAAFRKIPYRKSEVCGVLLPSARGIPYQCRRWLDETAKLPFWQTALTFQFGRLSHRSWQQLTNTYAAWHNHHLLPPYSAERRYDLLDFMPPTIQALDRHRFSSQQQTLPTPHAPQTIQLVTNCWGTVYEILRLAHKSTVESPILFSTAAQPMLTLLQTASIPVDAAAAQPGDLLLLSHQHGDRTYLDHVALVVDQGLFFEKAGTGDEVPYRLVDAATLAQIWNPAIFTYTVRRPLPQPLPDPSQAFSLQFQHRKPLAALWPHSLGAMLTTVEDPENPPILLWMQPLPPLQQLHARFQLHHNAYRPERLWPKLR